MKTKLSVIQMERVIKCLWFLHGINMAITGSRGRLCMAWKGNASTSVNSFSVITLMLRSRTRMGDRGEGS